MRQWTPLAGTSKTYQWFVCVCAKTLTQLPFHSHTLLIYCQIVSRHVQGAVYETNNNKIFNNNLYNRIQWLVLSPNVCNRFHTFCICFLQYNLQHECDGNEVKNADRSIQMSDDYMPENNLDGPPSKARKLSQGKCQWFAARRPWHHQAVDAQTAKQTWTLHLNWSMFRKFQAQTSNLATVGRQITVHFMAAIFFFLFIIIVIIHPISRIECVGCLPALLFRFHRNEWQRIQTCVTLHWSSGKNSHAVGSFSG